MTTNLFDAVKNLKKKLLFIDLTYLSGANREKYLAYIELLRQRYEILMLTTEENFSIYFERNPLIRNVISLRDGDSRVSPYTAYFIYLYRLVKIILKFKLVKRECRGVDVIYSSSSIFVDILAQNFISRLIDAKPLHVSVFDNFEEVNWKLWRRFFRLPQYLAASIGQACKRLPHLTMCYLPARAFDRFRSKPGNRAVRALRLNNTSNRLEIMKYRPLPDFLSRDIDFLYIGRIHFDKGIDRFLEALQELIDAGNDPKVIICGAGSDRKLINRVVSFSQQYRNAEYLGYVSDKYEILSRSKVVVAPSRRDSFPGTVIEAAMMGCKVITTDLDFTREEPYIHLELTILKEIDSLAKLMLDCLRRLPSIKRPDDYFDAALPTYESNLTSEVDAIESYL